MVACENPGRRTCHRLVTVSVFLTVLLILVQARAGQPDAVPEMVRIGVSAAVMECAAGAGSKAARATMCALIKDETGLNNEILPQKGWRELVKKMASGEIEVGVFQGYEFAWSQQEHSDLKPLALAVNVDRYPVACVVVHRNSPATGIADLAGKTVSIAPTSPGFLRVFLEHECQRAQQKPASAFFAKVVAPDSIEDALDDVVDGTPEATLVERAALEAFRSCKPARFNKLKVLARSEPFPPPVIACYGNALAEATRARFRKGLFEAGRNAKSELVLALLQITGFEAPPEDFGKVLTQTREKYPSPAKLGD
jgi:ABC-type phosphate/phosphonate transport system substrate-binding protein